MKTLKENMNGVIVCLCELLVGILLLIKPVGFTSSIIIAFGVAMLVGGIASIVKYFRTAPQEAAQGQMLLKGTTAALIGAFCALKSEWFIATFPILTVLYGVMILMTGLGKFQWTVDMLRMKKKNWFMAAVSTIISIVCGAIIIADPFGSTTVLWMFTGISLIIEAAFDMVALYFEVKGIEFKKRA